MLKINLDVPFRLTNVQAGNISHIELAQGIVRKVYVEFFD